MQHNLGPHAYSFFSQRLRLHYLEWGDREAPPLLLVHGGLDHCRNWDFLASNLAKDWRVITPDLRGHGDSEWASDGHYTLAAYVYDLAQLIHQLDLTPVTLIGHSLGGNIATRYAGIYPDHVRGLISIEGLGFSPKMTKEQEAKPIAERMRKWIKRQRAMAGRQPKRYETLEAAVARMQDENKHLTHDQAEHLTRYGVNQNEDGTYSWKFDNYQRAWPPVDMPVKDLQSLWSSITCPTLLAYGTESWASNPAEDGRLDFFKNAQLINFEGASHWVHHDRPDDFLKTTNEFLASLPS